MAVPTQPLGIAGRWRKLGRVRENTKKHGNGHNQLRPKILTVSLLLKPRFGLVDGQCSWAVRLMQRQRLSMSWLAIQNLTMRGGLPDIWAGMWETLLPCVT